MDLRDELAARVAAELASRDWDAGRVAERAYDIANAMLLARDRARTESGAIDLDADLERALRVAADVAYDPAWEIDPRWSVEDRRALDTARERASAVGDGEQSHSGRHPHPGPAGHPHPGLARVELAAIGKRRAQGDQ